MTPAIDAIIREIVEANTPVVDTRYRGRLAFPSDVMRAIQSALAHPGVRAALRLSLRPTGGDDGK